MSLIQTLDDLTACQSTIDADVILKNSLSNLGCQKFSYNFYAINFERNRKTKHILCTDQVQNWQDHYVQHNFEQIDPILKQMRDSTLPFGWKLEEEVKRCGLAQKRLFDDAIMFGLDGGFAVPIHSPCGEFANLVIQEATFLDILANNPSLKYDLHLLAEYYHAKIASLVSPTDLKVRLTQREITCLYFTAKHKTAKEIAKELKISPRTVGFHIENAIKKFNAKNKHQAVMLAVQTGLLS